MRYYFVDANNTPAGPFAREELLRRHREGSLNDQSLVVAEGESEWKSYAELFGPAAVGGTPPLSAPVAPATWMGRYRASWLLFRNSLSIMRRNKKLALFPVVITVCTLLIALFFIAPVLAQPTGYRWDDGKHWMAAAKSVFTDESVESMKNKSNATDGEARMVFKPAAVAYMGVIYIVSMFCATFFNVAFFNEILKALRGEEVSIRAGMRFACTRLKSILMWTLFAGLVGLIIQQLEERVGLVGRLALKLVGTAWSIAAVFAIPIIVREEHTTNPVRILKKSALALRQTWGESLVGYAGLHVGSGLILLGSLVYVVIGGILAVVFSSIAIGVTVLVTWFLAVIVFFYLLNVAGQIFRGVLYCYATEGVLPDPYTRDMIELAWKRKRDKRV